MSCKICNKENPKYKCPVCLVPYCSVSCCKKHKQTPCTPPPPKVEEEQTNSKSTPYQYPTEVTVVLDMLKLLDSSEPVKNCLNNPYLRDLLTKLDQCENAGKMIEECMQEPIFTEFVDECLKVILPESDD